MNEQPLLSKTPNDFTACSRPNAKKRGVPVSEGTALASRLLGRMRAFRGCVASLSAGTGRAGRVVLMGLLSLVASSAQAQLLPIDLSIRTTVSGQKPVLGDVLTYTVVVTNGAASTVATGVVVKNELPTGGVAYVPGSASVVRGNGAYAPATGVWNVGVVAPNDSAVLVLRATVLAQGVWFNTAEVAAADQADADSGPNNQLLIEDDYDAVCFSVPINWYPGDEYTVSVPSGYDQIVWYRNDGPISASTVAASLAVVNPDGSLTFKSPGTYRFVTFRQGCPATNCCNIEVIPGQAGSLGDKVFVDTDRDGQQGDPATEPGLPGVKVTLFQNTTPVASVTTTASGLYSFTGLTPGSGYFVVFDTTGLAARGYALTTPDRGADATDSDAGPNGRTTQTYSLTAGENNTSVDAGFQPTRFDLALSVNLASTGPFVPGDEVRYVLTLTNQGQVTAYNVDVTNWLPAGLLPLAGGSFTDVSSHIVTTTVRGPLEPGGVVSLTLVVRIDPAFAGGNLSILGEITAADNDQVAGNAPPVDIDSNPDDKVPAEDDIVRAELPVNTPVPVATARLGDRVFADTNKDGLQGDPATEPGIAGVVVVLLDGNLSPLTSTTTGASGQYSFTGLTPGVPYSLSFVTPVGYISTPANAGNDALDSDIDPLTGKTTQTYSLTAGENNTTVDAGFQLLNDARYDVAITKEVLNTGPYAPGGQVVYKLTVKNNSSVPVYQVGVDDRLPVGLSLVTANYPVGIDPGSGPASWVVTGPLAAQGTVVFTLTTQISGTYAAANLTNTAVISRFTATADANGSPAVDTNPANNTATVSVPVGTTGTTPVCSVTTPTVTAGLCQTATNTYATTVLVTVNNPAGGQTLTITDGPVSQTFVTTAGVSNSFTMIAGGLVPNGAVHTVTALLAGCGTATASYAAPVACLVVPPGCDTKPPLITCVLAEICQGGSTSLHATGCAGGTITWSDGQSGATVSVSPTVTTTYSAHCVLPGGCVSGASTPISVTVLNPPTPVITALPAAAVCPGTSLTLTATGCAGGTIIWSEGGRTGASIVVAPLGRTTYTAQCRVGSCLSNPATQTIDISTDLPAPTITCSTSVVCPGEPVTLTVNGCAGTPVWSSTTQITGSIVVTPTVDLNSYSVYCKNSGCTSKSSPVYTIRVEAAVIPTVTASADSVCAGGLVSLTATGCAGTVVWNAAGENGVSLTGSVIQVYPAASISYYAQCRVRTCLSDPSNAVPITVVTPSAPMVRSDKSLICSGDKVMLTAEGCEGTINWHGMEKMGASISLFPAETKEYYATCRQGSCESDPSNRVRVTVNTTGTAPDVAASAISVCNGGLVSLTATGCAGTVIWSDGQTGPIVSVMVTPTNREFYALCKIGTRCGSGPSFSIRIDITSAPKPTVTCSTDVICPGEPVTLTVNNCGGTPHWSSNETTNTIVVSPAVTTSYTVYCQNGACRSETSPTYTIRVVPVPAPAIAASATTVEPGGTVSLSATGCPGQVTWSAIGTNGINKGTVIVVRPEGTQAFYAQCSFRACLSDPSATLVVNPRVGDCSTLAGTLIPVSATVSAGTAQTVVVAARTGKAPVLPPGYSIRYVLTEGTGLVIGQVGTTPTFTVPATPAAYTLHAFVFNADPSSPNYFDLLVVKPGITTAADLLALIDTQHVCANLDMAGAGVTVTGAPGSTVAPPVLTVSSQTVCAGTSVTFSASGCAGGIVRWSDGATGPTLSKLINGAVQLTATCTLNGLTSAPSTGIGVTLSAPGIPTIVSNRPTTVCPGESVTLTATGCAGGQYHWSDGTTGSTLTVTPVAEVSYRVTCQIGSCESSWSALTTVDVGAPAAPVISVAGLGTAGVNSATVCFGAPVTLTAQGCPVNSTVTWSHNLVGTSITVALVNSETYTARCVTSATCRSAASNAITITVLPKPTQPLTVDRTNVCSVTTVDLATGVTSIPSTPGGLFEYYASATLSTDSKIASPAAAGAGTYYVVERTVNGCYSPPAPIHVQITGCNGTPVSCDPKNPVTANAGANATLCAAKSYSLSGSMGGAGKTTHWATTGSGTFNNPFAANAVYTASADDVLAGAVTLTLSVSAGNAACPVAKDDMLLTIQGSPLTPTVTVVGTTILCPGDSVTLQAPAGSGYLWSNRAKTDRIVVKTGGTYSVQLLDPDGCASVKSADVTVTVSQPVPSPLVANLRNTCPALVADLTSALSGTVAGRGYEYRIGPSASSRIVTRPDSVGAGTYYIFGKAKGGCLSAPAAVTVTIRNCAADSVTTDLSLTKTVSKTAVAVGDTIAYTIRVRNLGPHTATNVDVRDVLPKGLILIPAPAPTGASASYTAVGGTITKRIDSLRAGQSSLLVFAARVVAKGSITNRADITYLDQRDPMTGNNRSEVTVGDTTVAKPGLVGLAKSVVGTPRALGDSLIQVRYSFVLTNFGDDTLRRVRVTDDLAYVFSPNAVVSAGATLKSTGNTLVLNPAFTGRGNNTVLFDTASYLLPRGSQRFILDVTVRRAAGDTTRTFRNIASVTAQNSITAVNDLSADGIDPDPDGDGNPTNNTSYSPFTLGNGPAGPAIGIALAVVKVVPQANGSYNVTYKATIRNTGDVPLTGVSLTDTLSRAFTAPASYSVAGAPVVRTGSHLVANARFNGSTQPNLLTNASTLAVGEQDTLLVTVTVRPNSRTGPFYTTATATGQPVDSSQVVRDRSNDGFDPTVVGAVPTAVRFDLPQGLLGVAKSVGTPTRVGDGVYDVPYGITVSNLGSVALKNVQVVDNLAETFKNGALIVSNRVAVKTGTGLTADSLYTGQGTTTKLLIDSLSRLPVGASRSLTFTVRVNVKNADSLTFHNAAVATALTDGNERVEDRSTAGVDNDPDHDLDPRNNSVPTPVSLKGASGHELIGVAMAVRDTTRQADGTFNVTYQIVLRNYGREPLTHVGLTDSLSTVFNTTVGTTYALVRVPFTTSTGSALLLNPNFNGATDRRIVLGDSLSTLAAGKMDTILVLLNIRSDGRTTTFLNSAYAQAKSGTQPVSDVSTSGLNPDLNGNNNPTDANEREATPLNLPSTSSDLFIPQGFSPNGDGINDRFVIGGMGSQTISLEVYNRWGHLVYTNADYRNDWDGQPNTGITVGGENADGLPDGTYYYVIRTSDGRRFVRYLTINR